MTKNYEFHEVANIFPMMSDDEFKTLADDIKSNGLYEAICLYEGKIIDGRNRYKACLEAGVTPHFCEWDGNGSLTSYVVSLNINRRHLNASQKAVIAVEIEKRFSEEAKERQRLAGGDRKSESFKKSVVAKIPQPIIGNDNALLQIDEEPQKEKPAQATTQEPVLIEESKQEQTTKARDLAAEYIGASPRYVSDAKRIQKTHPEKIKEIQVGKKTVSQAIREIKEESNPKPKPEPTPEKKEEESKPVKKKKEKRQEYIPSEGMYFAVIAISQLSRIEDNDSEKIAAFKRVYDHMAENSNGRKFHD